MLNALMFPTLYFIILVNFRGFLFTKILMNIFTKYH